MFNDIIQTWLETAQRRPDLATSTKVTYARIAQHLMAWPAGADDALALPEYVAARRAADIAPRTVALELRVLSVATHWAERHLGAGRPPVLPKVRIDPRVYVLNHRTPTPSQAAAALRAMPQDEWHLAARLIAATGARVGEVLALRSVDLDMAAGRIALGASEGASKTGMRWFPLDAASLRSLAGREGRGRVPWSTSATSPRRFRRWSAGLAVRATSRASPASRPMGCGAWSSVDCCAPGSTRRRRRR